jgi:TolA-binding protein
MSAPCPRLFEVEALRDGRLSGPELTHFRAHLSVCPDCAREAEALDALGAALRNAPNASRVDELQVRRERTRLLAAFDAHLVPTPRARGRAFRYGLASATLSLLAVLVFAFWRDRSPAPITQAADPVLIRGDSNARWSRQSEGQLDRIRLEQGALSIRVDHTTETRHVVVILPDGELEDIGTTFSVSADAGRTTSVSVQEGSVVLRLRGELPRVLGAGDTWSPPAAPPTLASSSPTDSEAVATPPGPSSTGSSAAPPMSGSRLGAKSLVSAGARPVPPTDTRDPAADFRTAMEAFNGGDHQRAAALFGAFLSQHSRDPRAEDAAYLRVLASHRAGDSAATRRTARDYLRHYPQGFRRAEVEALGATVETTVP